MEGNTIKGDELHKKWDELDIVRDETRRGTTNMKDMFYYEKDRGHAGREPHLEVYSKVGGKGVHQGVVWDNKHLRILDKSQKVEGRTIKNL